MSAGSISVPQIIPLRPPYGHRKHIIDSNTEIEIRSESKGCDVFYTINNKKPDPFQEYGEKYTYKFKRTFTLSPGKIIIKAMAMISDGSKQSSVVTRTFNVYEAGEQLQKMSKDDADEEQLSQLDISLSEQFREQLRTSSRESIRSGLVETIVSKSPSSLIYTPRQHSPSPQPFYQTHNSPILSSTPHGQNLSNDNVATPIYIPQATQIKPRSVNTCPYCTAMRRVDSKDEYCTQCGSIIPPLPIMNTPQRMSICKGCGSQQSSDSEMCVVCDAPVLQPYPLPTIKTQTKQTIDHEMESVICLQCGTHNASHLSNCVTCDSSLYVGPINDIHVSTTKHKETVMYPITGSTYIMCGTCGRVNVSDARYCDWCGCRPSGCNIQLMCQTCTTENDWIARFCSKCGSVMKCPLRPDVEQKSKMQMPKGTKFDHCKWVPIADVDIPTEDKCVLAQPYIKSQGTQTQGLFYPSAKSITAKKYTEAWQKLIKTSSKDRVLELSAYSPGKGMWRSQLDHICSHLRAYSTSNMEFQDIISHHQLGKLVTTSTEEDRTNNQLLLKLVFTLKNGTDTTISRYQSTPIKGEIRRKSSLNSTIGSSTLLLEKKPSLRRSSSSHMNIKVEDHLLAAEVSTDGEGRKDIVTSLLEKGAKVNAVDTTRGLPVLIQAASNGHLEAMNALIEHGADLNSQTKRTGNSALHEAVTCGMEGKDAIKILLRYDSDFMVAQGLRTLSLDQSQYCHRVAVAIQMKQLTLTDINHGANPTIRNKENLTPCELASKLGHKRLVSLFANHLGSGLLAPLVKRQSQTSLNT